MMSTSGPSTIVAALRSASFNRPHQIALSALGTTGGARNISNRELWDRACVASGGLRGHGASQGDRIVLALPAGVDLVAAYLGAMSNGAVPLIVPPSRSSRAERQPTHLGQDALGAGALLVVVADEVAEVLQQSIPIPVVSAHQLREDIRPVAPLKEIDPTVLAHLQQTSGSTGSPRCAAITHGNIVANVRAIGEAISHRDDDLLLSWLPLFHDMGLIGLCYAIYWGCPLVLIDTPVFTRNPLSWLRLMSQYRATLCPAPSSAIHVCARLAARRIPAGIDLSSWRALLLGAEPIRPQSVRSFESAFAPLGLRPNTTLPVYGMAETTLAATLSDVGLPMRTAWVDASSQKVFSSPPQDQRLQALEVASVGTALKGHELRIVNDSDEPVAAKTVGNIEFAGPSVVCRYSDRLGDSPTAMTGDGFLQTGDVGFLEEGRLFITGRKKDIIISRGRNFAPEQVEAIAMQTLAAQCHHCAAVGLHDDRAGCDMIHLIIEASSLVHDPVKPSEDFLRSELEALLGVSGITIHWRERRWLPVTTSGKVRRFYIREKLLNGARGSS